MPRVIFSPGAVRDLERLRAFLREKNPAAARRAAEVIKKAVSALEKHPQLGRPADDLPPEFRELVIDFGDSGYVLMYRHANGEPDVVILTVRHQKEAGKD